MKKMSPFITRFSLVAVTFGLLSCESGDPIADMEMDMSMMGNEKLTTFTMNADGAIRIKDIAVAGETIRVARKLNKSETEILRLLAQQKFDGFKVTALEELRPKYEKKKAVVQQETARRKQVIQATAEQKAAAIESTAGPQAPEAKAVREQAAAQIATVAAEESSKIAFIDSEWQKEAVDKIRTTYGTNFAVPVKSAPGEAVVAFASVDDNGIVRPSDNAYALNTTSNDFLAKAVSGRAVVKHEGAQSYVLASEPQF